MDVVSTGDGLLLGAYILKAFRIAAANAVVRRLERVAATRFGHSDPAGAVYRVFAGIADAWDLSPIERARLLGLEKERCLASIEGMPSASQPPEILQRVAVLADIFFSINTLIPVPDRADAWLRRPNKAAIMGGRSALEFMLERDLEGMRALQSFLAAEVHGC